MAKVSGTFTAVGGTSDWVGLDDVSAGRWAAPGEALTLMVTGSFTGSITLEVQSKSQPGKIAPVAIDATGAALVLSAPAALTVQVPSSGLEYRLRCTARSSGTIEYQLGSPLS